MNKTVTIQHCIDDSLDMVLRLRVQDSDIKSWCVALSMMQNDVVDEIVIRDDKSRKRILLNVLPLKRAKKSFYEINQKSINVTITYMELLRWIGFLLDYELVGSSPVNHLDLELTSRVDSVLPKMCVVLMVSNLQPRN